MILALVKFKKEQVGEVLQRLYAEFFFKLESICGFGFCYEMNGLNVPPIPHKIDQTSPADVLSELAYRTAKSFPESDFSTWYKSLQE